MTEKMSYTSVAANFSATAFLFNWKKNIIFFNEKDLINGTINILNFYCFITWSAATVYNVFSFIKRKCCFVSPLLLFNSINISAKLRKREKLFLAPNLEKLYGYHRQNENGTTMRNGGFKLSLKFYHITIIFFKTFAL